MEENEEKKRDFIIPEWKRSKDAIIDSYLLTINSLAEVLPKYHIKNQIMQSRLDDWRKGAIALFYQIREHEKSLMDITDISDEIRNIEKLTEFTNTILETQTLKDIKEISRKKDHDPIVQYKKEAYK